MKGLTPYRILNSGVILPFVMGFLTFYFKDDLMKLNYKEIKSLPEKMESQDEEPLQKFDIKKIKMGDNIFIVGKRSVGKTTLVGKILNAHPDIPVGTVVSPTESLERFYTNFVDTSKTIIHKSYNSCIIGSFIKAQIDDINSHIIEDNECFIILDNCLLKAEYNDSNLTDLLVNGYFYKTINVITAAFPLGFSKHFKTSINYAFIFKDSHVLYKKLIYDEYFKTLMSEERYTRLLEEYTSDHGCLVIDFEDNGKIYYF